MNDATTTKRVYAASPEIADFDALAKLSATRKVKAVAMWCARNRIQTFRDTKGRPCSTLEAINDALRRGVDADNEPRYDLIPAKPTRITKRLTV